MPSLVAHAQILRKLKNLLSKHLLSFQRISNELQGL